ncbi:MAG TPA: hypothetical protein VE198_01685, partial [Actinoallomurus sp.]|nr:hypothetical protein [Actinoallomurus sp.]
HFPRGSTYAGKASRGVVRRRGGGEQAREVTHARGGREGDVPTAVVPQGVERVHGVAGKEDLA